MGRTLVIGDIHGNAKALQQVLERANVTDDDTIIQLGDVADGWSETTKCVEILLSLPNLISLRGNHDVWVYDWINYGTQDHIWTTQGGQATVDSYGNVGALMDRNHKDFWNNQVDWYIDDQNRLFIHAGWGYTLPGEFEKQASYRVNAGTIAKECHWDRDLLRGAKSGAVVSKATGEASGFKALEQFKEVYIGHTATHDALPHNYLNLWNLDTGAGWHGKLTIMDIDSKEYWQSDFAKELYADEKGRK